MDDPRVIELLTEIRDTEREHLAEYRRIAGDALATQKAVAAKYEQMMRLYRVVVGVGAVTIALLLFAAAWLTRLL